MKSLKTTQQNIRNLNAKIADMSVV